MYIPNKNFNRLFCGYQLTDSKVCIEWQKTQNGEQIIEREEQNRRTGTILLQDLL